MIITTYKKAQGRKSKKVENSDESFHYKTEES